MPHAARRLAAATFLVLAACKAAPAPVEDAPAGERAAEALALGDTARIAVGREASFDGGRLVVRFEAVDQDSRCPADAMCVHQGDVEARFRLTRDGRRAGTVLHQNGQPQEVEYFGYVVRLVNVLPYPGTYDRSKPAPAPVAEVVVRRG